MPRKPRDPQTVEAIRETFLTTAVGLLIRHGYDGFSIRQLARELKIVAATLYNYFPGGKDELYLLVAARGYDQLNRQFTAATLKNQTPGETVRALALAYLEFGMNQPHYYNLLFNSHAPKYMDYRGTPLEPIAQIQNDAALGVASAAAHALSKLTQDTDQERLSFRLLQLWSMLHGIVSLKNSRVTEEVIHMSQKVIDRYLNEALEAVLPGHGLSPKTQSPGIPGI